MIVSATGLLTGVALAVAAAEVEVDLHKEWLRRRVLSGIPVAIAGEGPRMGTRVSSQQEKPQRSPKFLSDGLLGSLLYPLPAPRDGCFFLFIFVDDCRQSLFSPCLPFAVCYGE